MLIRARQLGIHGPFLDALSKVLQHINLAVCVNGMGGLVTAFPHTEAPSKGVNSAHSSHKLMDRSIPVERTWGNLRGLRDQPTAML